MAKNNFKKMKKPENLGEYDSYPSNFLSIIEKKFFFPSFLKEHEVHIVSMMMTR